MSLPAAGLSADRRGRIVVNEAYQTAVPHVCAVGIKATSVPHLFPYGIYSVPEISMVGKNAEELTTARIPHEIGSW